MLSRLMIENFKGFSTAQTIPLGKITLLFGPNSSGKSSVLHSLLLLKQTLQEAETPATVVLPKGRLVDLGSFRDMVHAHDLSRSMRFGFAVTGVPEAEEWVSEEDDETPFWLSFTVRSRTHSRTTVSELSVGSHDWDNAICRYQEAAPRERMRAAVERGPALQFERMNRDHAIFRAAWPRAEAAAVQFVKRFAELSKKVEAVLTDAPSLSRVSLDQTADINLLMRSTMEARSPGITPNQAFQFARYLATLAKPTSPTQVIERMRSYTLAQFLSDVEEKAKRNPLLLNHFLPRSVPRGREAIRGDDTPIPVPDVGRVASSVGRALFRRFVSAGHLGPLREHPERHYIFSGTAASDVGKSGKFAPDLLYSEPRLVRAINGWFEKFKIAHRLRVRRIGASVLSDVYALRLVDANTEIDVGAPDVGFGLSQVLPVLVQSLFSSDALLLVEQPELHLHPALQAELGSFFAWCIGEARSPNQYIIETHSEHLLLRLQALVRAGQLEARDVSIIALESVNGETRATPIGLDEHGRFRDAWPGGFFPERLRELR